MLFRLYVKLKTDREDPQMVSVVRIPYQQDRFGSHCGLGGPPWGNPKPMSHSYGAPCTPEAQYSQQEATEMKPIFANSSDPAHHI